MKIAFIVCAYPPDKTGIGNSAFYFASGLADRGHQVAVLTAKRKSLKDFGNSGFNHEVRRLPPLFRLGYGAILAGLGKRLHGFDIAHLHYPYYGAAEQLLALKIASPSRFKLAVHYHMDNPALGWPARIMARPALFLKPRLFRTADAVSCASFDYLAHSEIKHIYRADEKKFFETPFGVDAEQFAYKPKGELKKSLLFVGGLDRAHEFKGVPVLLRALAAMNDPSVRLTIVGRGGLEPAYCRLADRLGLAGQVEFAGPAADADLPAYYQAADAFALPSTDRNEAFGLVLLEAMSCGTPVIATDLPGVRRVFRSGQEGFIARAGDAADLAAKLSLIIYNRSRRDEMGAAGRRLVLEKYVWPESCARLEEMYKIMLAA